MLIHRISVDAKLRKAALAELSSLDPLVVAAFSFVEFKGNYIQDLVLLRNRIGDSDSFEEVYARAEKIIGRKGRLMISQLIKLAGEANMPWSPWPVCQSTLLTMLDTHLLLVWDSLSQLAPSPADPFACTRASEKVEVVKNQWNATIPKCKPSNTTCTISAFSVRMRPVLQQIVTHLQGLPSRTAELDRILTLALEAMSNPFPWERQVCRKVGDLLIGLTSIGKQGLVTSNKNEHDELSKAAGYVLHLFDVVANRS